MKTILADLDGVCVQYDFVKLTQKYFGQTIPNTRVWCYSLEDSLGVSPEAVDKMFKKEAHTKPNFIPGAVDTLRYFMSKDYEVYILTNRLHFMTSDELVSWLEKYHIPYSGLITNGDLPTYVHAQIDDSPTKLMYVRDNVEVKHSILFQNPWNKRCLNITGVLEKAKNWKEVREVVDEKR